MGVDWSSRKLGFPLERLGLVALNLELLLSCELDPVVKWWLSAGGVRADWTVGVPALDGGLQSPPLVVERLIILLWLRTLVQARAARIGGEEFVAGKLVEEIVVVIGITSAGAGWTRLASNALFKKFVSGSYASPSVSFVHGSIGQSEADS